MIFQKEEKMKLLIRRYNEPKETNLVSTTIVSTVEEVRSLLAQQGRELSWDDEAILKEKIAKVQIKPLTLSKK